MIPTEKSSPADLQFLLDASKYLLGYRVHVAYNHYINFIGDNFLRWHSRGLIRNLLEPAPGMAQAVVLDFSALDIQTMARVLGTYYYIMSCHKGANYRLMHLFPGKQILYLRGYDFAGSLGLGGGLASGYSTPDTMRFNGVLSGLLASDACLFRILSPEEAYWENITAEEHFLRLDIDGLVQKALRPYRSFYLNASVWRARLLDLIDRMDHFIVYVSAATESALWELEQLATDERRGRVTVVFDPRAIRMKDAMTGFQAQMQSEGKRLVWKKEGAVLTPSPEDLHSKLSEWFVVVTLDDFEKNIDEHRGRIAASCAALPPGQRETWLEFEYYPAVDEDKLNDLREFDSWLRSRIDTWIDERAIQSLLLLLNYVHLNIYTGLLLGEHCRVGRALATYHATLRAFREWYSADPHRAGEAERETRERELGALDENIELSAHWAVTLMASGDCHQFESLLEAARAEFALHTNRIELAVKAFLETC